MTVTATPDWQRMQKALAVEAERGFQDLQGRQYRFSEFLTLSFGIPLPQGTRDQQRRWQDFAQQFANYPDLSLDQRQALVAGARRFLRELRQPPPPEPPARPAVATLPLVAQASESYEADITLDQILDKIPAIPRRYHRDLSRLELRTVRDLLFYYPRDHINYSRHVNIVDLKAGETVTIIGTVRSCKCFTSPRNPKLAILEIVVRDRTASLRLSRFYAGKFYTQRAWQESIKRQYPSGATIAASGLVKLNKYGISLDNPAIEVLDSGSGGIESLNIGRILPVYPLVEGVKADAVRQSVSAVLPATATIIDPLPKSLRQHHDLMPAGTALAHIHFPPDTETLDRARRRLIFDEFFYLQLGFLERRAQLKQSQTSVVLPPTGQLLEQFQQLLPFQLTAAQQRVVSEILTDLNTATPMNRLVQGDVGSGKTVVAVIAILAAIQAGYQAALMAPTEVLAEQHYQKLVGWFNLLHLPVELLTGSTKTRQRRQLLAQLATGELPLLVGTHALIEDAVQFQQLGLVVIDEQHRFGVQQRARLLAKGNSPHVLTMTATPIPRTLALTLHGDLDVSQIDELPPGRQAIQTTVLSSRQRPAAYELIRREVAQGRQAYIVFPAIDLTLDAKMRAATVEHRRLQDTIFPEWPVGLLHGRMKPEEKEAAIARFRDQETPIIVSTTVIEVGVDVPNATVMAIENAERFGLSQLHQLRGRVGRGAHKSYCLLIAADTTPEARQRLGVLEQSQDGFFIAEMDLRLRGPGEVLGKRQSGLPDFALASLQEDQEILSLARDAAEEFIRTDPTLQSWPALHAELATRYEKLLGGPLLN